MTVLCYSRPASWLNGICVVRGLTAVKYVSFWSSVLNRNPSKYCEHNIFVFTYSAAQFQLVCIELAMYECIEKQADIIWNYNTKCVPVYGDGFAVRLKIDI